MINGLNPETCIVNLYSQHHGKILADQSSEGSCSEDESDCETESDEDTDNGIEYQKERWYGAKYTKEKLPKNLLEIMCNPEVSEDCKMGDPPQNILFPHDLSILAETEFDSKIPIMIHNDANMEIWHQKCTKFKVPSVIVVDNFYTNDCGFHDTIEGRAFIQIWSRVVREYFREFNYMAEQASMCFSLSYDIDSIEFYFRGYADKLEGFIYD